jgi:hypothetical protein
VQQRGALKLSLAAVSILAGAASLVSGNYWFAVALIGVAASVAVIPIGRAVSQDHVKTLLESLSIARQTGAMAVRAVVMSRIIFITKSAFTDTASRGHLLLFRDEVEPGHWRELSTLLRHQAPPSPELKKVEQLTR